MLLFYKSPSLDCFVVKSTPRNDGGFRNDEHRRNTTPQALTGKHFIPVSIFLSINIVDLAAMKEISDLHGVGKQLAKCLARLGITEVQDLLFHLPLRYQDRTHLQMIRDLKDGDEAVIEAVISAVIHPPRGRTKLLCELRDETGKLYLRFFHVLSFQTTILKVGTRLRCYGSVRLGQKGMEMFHPEFQVIAEGKSLPIEPHLTPIYPATEGLSQYRLRKLTTQALSWSTEKDALTDCLPAALMKNLALPNLHDALHFVHRPPRDTAISQLIENKTAAQKRLIFEELLAHRISLLQLKHSFQQQKSVSLEINQTMMQVFLQHLPFQLTTAQTRVLSEIHADLMKSQPMLRLIQGDVGSGKTIIAALAMLQAVANGHQAVIMAPTELLAEQHYKVMQRCFAPLAIQVALLSGQIKSRSAILKSIANAEAQIIIGTHALFQQKVDFAKLALIVIDEQHRFGVEQRASLREKAQKNYYPHQLMMTATPIPRTLAMSLYADLDCSTIDELPPGRTPVITSVMSSHKRDDIIARVREACQQGRQVYWVCPLIEESEAMACQAATTTSQSLTQLLTDIKIGLIHGRMRAQEKEIVMRAFQAGEIHLLVATTVIEVGVDVANASVMIIENAERLGLSQLHQLRGRVGRGSTVSYCILLYQYLSEIAKERLAVMRDTTDGFKIAQRDLELRGPGEVLGVRQTGELSFKVADLLRDRDILAEVNQAADIFMRDHAENIPALIARWIGRDGDYG